MHGKYVASARAKKVASASVWMLVIAIMQILFGAFLGFSNSKQADAAVANLAQFEAEEIVEAAGEQYVVSDLLAQVERERLQGFVVPIGLGLVFLGLYFWGRRAPVPAITTALLLFVTVHTIEAVIDPVTILRGIVLKLFFVAGLVGGLKAALAQRDSQRIAADGTAA